MRQLEKIALATFGFIAFSYIISAAYFGIDGQPLWWHPLRQSDTYGHILGFMEFKDFTPYDQFHVGEKKIFDIPIYQYIIAQTSLLLESEPLVTTRFMNVLFWAITAFSGYKICRSLGRPTAGMIFVFLMATSPLILYYHSEPLPDTMAIALSLFGLQVLYKHGLNWKSVICALPCLAIATLIKSPIPFVFVVFYSTYIMLSATYKNTSLRAMMAKYAPFITLLAIILLLAILAELLRANLLPQYTINSTDSYNWYFGTWEMRTSAEFWQTVWLRFDDSATSSFGYIYPIVIAIACLIKREKHHIIVIISALVAFFAGWLIFSNLYKIHNYYQLPVAIVTFISFAVSLSHIFAYIIDKIPTRHQKNFATIGVVMVILFSFHQMMTQGTSNDRGQIRKLLSGIEYAMREQNLLLYVVSPEPYYRYSTHIHPVDTTIGAMFSTKFKTISKEDFENNCTDYIKEYPAILATNYSECLVNNKKNASYFIKDDYVIFYLNTSNVLKSKLDIATRAAPVIDATFKVYIEDGQMVYIKTPCVANDIKADFILRIIPINTNDLPTYTKHNGFENLDFEFSKYGLIINGMCIATRDLPNYKIKEIITGRITPTTGIIWEGVINPNSVRKVLTSKLDIATWAEPVIDTTFKVYIEDDQLVYIKESCTKSDTKAIFFLHLTPENITDLPEGRQKHGFQGLDFDFTKYGLITNGTCIAVRDLPSYKIKQITTGQFIPATGQRVWEKFINPIP